MSQNLQVSDKTEEVMNAINNVKQNYFPSSLWLNTNSNENINIRHKMKFILHIALDNLMISVDS